MRPGNAKEALPSSRFVRFLRDERAVLLGFALVKLALHLATAGRYGYFCDESYTAAAGRHLLQGLVDLPPLVPLLSRLSGLAFGYSMFAVRLVPALAGAATVWFAGLTARKMGGGRFAQALTAACVLLGPLWLAFDSFFAYDCIDQLVLAVLFFFIVRALKSGEPKAWIAVGAFAGLALLVKYTILFLGFALVLALLATKARRVFAWKQAWAGAGIFLAAAGLVALWQASLGWPVLEYWANYASFRTYHLSAPDFLVSQLVVMNPFTAPLWLGGLAWLLSGKAGRELRTLGALYLFAIAVFLFTHAKGYMSLSLYPYLFAAGGMALEKLFAAGWRRGLRIGYAALAVLAGLALAPNGLPLFEAPTQALYCQALSRFMRSARIERSDQDVLPQHFADRFGWDEEVAAIAEVYEGLSPEEKASCGIFTAWYGEAGAVDLLGPRYGLPPASSGHLSYSLWGPATPDATVWICIGVPMDGLRIDFTEVRAAGRVPINPYAMPRERGLTIYVCRGPRRPITELWSGLRHFD